MAGQFRLGVVLSTATEAPPKEFVELGKLAEDRGFAALLVNEGRGDALACAEAIALATSRIQVGTNIANIYFRHPFLAAMTAWTIAELSDGRLVLGLGVSHRPLIESLGMKMDQPRAYMRSYVQTLKKALGGESTGAFFRPRASQHHVPVYVASVTAETAAVGGEEADGIMPFLPARTYLPTLMRRPGPRLSGSAKRPIISTVLSVFRLFSLRISSRHVLRPAIIWPFLPSCPFIGCNGGGAGLLMRSTPCNRSGKPETAKPPRPWCRTGWLSRCVCLARRAGAVSSWPPFMRPGPGCPCWR